MWIFLADSFLSIVAVEHDPYVLTVRARAQGDIEKVFPDAKVERTPQADYGFRAVIERELVAKQIRLQVLAINQTNFKNSVTDPVRKGVYERVWAVMNDFQKLLGLGGKYNTVKYMGYLHEDIAYDGFYRRGGRGRRR